MTTKLDIIAQINYAERKGREEGAAEGKAEVARNMLAMNMNVDVITKATGLSAEEVEALAVR